MAKRQPKPYKVGDPLTPKQQKWIDEYIKCNDLTVATRNAGYGGDERNLRAMGYQNKQKFKDLLEARQKELNDSITSKTVAELEDIYEFWTGVLNDPNARMTDRLKASEYLAKAKGGFIEKRQVQVIDTDWYIE